MTISSLINNITGSIQGLGASLGLTSAKSNPNYIAYPDLGIDAIDASTKERWFNYATERYVFGVLNEGDDLTIDSEGTRAVKSITSLFGAGGDASSGGFDDFKLPLTPQEIVQSEDFATGIRPTLGGTAVQHSGVRYKDLTISGTTGVHPFRGSTGVNRINGAAIFQPDELKYRSGYEVFIHFRNWLKSYAETKKLGGKNASLRMIFKNFKDWEFLIVEPVKFTMKRDANRPLLYNYTLQMKVLGHYKPEKPNTNFLDQIDNALNVAKASMEVSRGIFLKFQEVIRSVAGEVDGVIENLRLLNLAVKAAKGIGTTMSDVSNRIEANFLSQRDALRLSLKLSSSAKDLSNNPRSAEASGVDLSTTPQDPDAFSRGLRAGSRNETNAVSQFLKAKSQMGNAINSISIDDYPLAARNAILLEQEQAALISRVQVENIRSQIDSLKSRFSDAIGLGDESYDAIFGRIPGQDVSPESENTDNDFEILYAFNTALEGVDSILATDEMFDINASLYSKADSVSGAETVGQGIFSSVNPNSGVREGIVPVGASLEDIALIELGDASRWTELAQLNGLKHPYIDNSNSSSKKVNYQVKSAVYYNPADLQTVSVGSFYIVAPLPTPAGAWAGKPNKIAKFLGGDKTQASSWLFISAPVGTVVEVKDWQTFLELSDSLTWEETEVVENEVTEVLRPGDVIKIPVDGGSAPTSFVRGPRDNPALRGLSASEQALAVDLRVDENSDLMLGPSGDLMLATGATNMAQAIVLKLLYEKGDLKKHLEIGTQLKVGGKVPSASAIRKQIMTSLIQDERIRDVRNINIRQQNSGIEVTFDVYLIQVSEPVPITIPI